MHSELDHASATSFSPYPSVGGGGQEMGVVVGAGGGLGSGGVEGGVQAMAVAEYQPTPANLKEMQQAGPGGVAMVDVVDMPVPISVSQQ